MHNNVWLDTNKFMEKQSILFFLNLHFIRWALFRKIGAIKRNNCQKNRTGIRRYSSWLKLWIDEELILENRDNLSSFQKCVICTDNSVPASSILTFMSRTGRDNKVVEKFNGHRFSVNKWQSVWKITLLSCEKQFKTSHGV